MAELWFVGAGLGDEKDLSRRAFDLLTRCDRVFAEEYTSKLSEGSFERLAGEIGRPITCLDRAELEGEATILAALEKGDRVALVVPGDPFAATTHVALRGAAERHGHSWGYVPNASILTAAAGFLGLVGYRFGRTASLPFPEAGFAPVSPLDAIRGNRSSGLHTLVLLDLRPREGRFLAASEALRILRERDVDRSALPLGSEVAVVARVGTDRARAWYGPWERLMNEDFGPPLHALVIPADPLHFEELSALGRFRLP